MVEIDPISRKRFTRDRFSGDIQLDGFGDAALSQERIPVIGGFKDFTGSGGVPTKQLMFFPAPNELDGTDVALEGARKDELDILGGRKRTTRLRTKKFILPANPNQNSI